MTDDNRFGRQVAGLTALNRMKRPEVTPEPAPDAPEATPQAAQQPSVAPARASGARKAPARPSGVTKAKKAPQKAAQRSADADAPKEQLGARISRDVGNRARAAYRATGYLEGDASFAEFVETAILREVERREHTSNGGQPFPQMGDRLPAGRPLKA